MNYNEDDSDDICPICHGNNYVTNEDGTTTICPCCVIPEGDDG